jgi:hypothetical protein
MSFYEIRFQGYITYSVMGELAFSTPIIVKISGYEQRNINWSSTHQVAPSADSLNYIDRKTFLYDLLFE